MILFPFQILQHSHTKQKEILGLRLYSNKDLKHGEIELKVNGIKVTKKLSR